MGWAFKTKDLTGLMAGLWITFASVSAALADTGVFAAASLRGVLDEVAALSDTPVTLSYAGSGTIARQVAQGAPADVVILAHADWMDWLGTQNLLRPGTRQVIARNALVVIGAAGSEALSRPDQIAERLGPDGRLAMGQRDAVPAGLYARAWLENTGTWDALQTRLAETDNVRAALAFVARGETPLGVVYATDAQSDPKVSVVYSVPAGLHPDITYPAASLSAAGDGFVALLKSPAARAVFAKHGFAAP